MTKNICSPVCTDSDLTAIRLIIRSIVLLIGRLAPAIAIRKEDVCTIRPSSALSRVAIKAGELAEEQGYAQVLWLDGVEKKYVEEVGSMNIMFKIDGKVYTAATVGTVLPGVTRRSCIELLKDWGYEVVEGKIAIADIMAAAREGKLEEVFGTGTAAVVSPVKELVWKGEHAYIGDGKIGPVTQKLYDTMTGMQWGKLPDTKGWIVPVEKKN